MVARIFRPAKTAMQSGKGRVADWVLDYEPEAPKALEPLMGYTSSGDMAQQVRLGFETREQAEAYARRNGLAYRVIEPKESKPKRLSYSDNFKFARAETWTH
jgi:hypothetical protein